MGEIIKVIPVPDASADWEEDGHLYLTQMFRVQTSGRVHFLQILAHDDIPKRYSVYPGLEAARCIHVSPRRLSPGNRLFEVGCHYTTNWMYDIENPLERPADISWRDAEYPVPALYDLDGKPFISTSGEVLEDVMIESPGEIATIVKNVSGMPAYYGACRNAVNAHGIWIDGSFFDAGLCRVKSRQLSGWQMENDISYRVLTLEIYIRELGWQLELLNRGFYELVSETSGDKTKKVRKRIQIDGRGCVEPQLLDLDGQVIKFRDDDGNLIPAAFAKVRAAVQKFKVRKLFDFSQLPLR